MISAFELDFTKSNKADLPFPSRAAIYVKTCSLDKRDRIFITPQDCLDMKELDCHINRLIKELEDIRKKAKRKFSVK